MRSEKLNQLLDQVHAHQQALRLLHDKINETLEEDTDKKLCLCSFATPDVHVYCGSGEYFDTIKELADEGSIEQRYTYEDGTALYDFTLNGITCVSIGPAEEE